MVTQRIALNTASGASLVNRKISFAGTDVSAPIINFVNTAAPALKTVYAAEVLGEATVDFTTANNTTYSFTIKQTVGAQEMIFPISYTSDAGATEDEIEDALGAQLTILIDSGALKASFAEGTTAITITALAGYPLLQVIAGQNTTVGSVTVGKNAVNKGADLLAAGVDNAVSGNTYTSYEFITADLSLSAGQERNVWKKLIVYIKTSQGAIAALDTILENATFQEGGLELIS